MTDLIFLLISRMSSGSGLFSLKNPEDERIWMWRKNEDNV